MKIEVGSIAPILVYIVRKRKRYHWKIIRGKNIVLLFFPLAFTGVCTKELCNVRDTISIYNNANAEVIAISVDSPQTLAKFKEDQKLNFELLSDFNKVVSEMYGCLYETFSLEMKGVSKRSAFVIDGDGIIRYAEVLENAGEQPNFQAITDCLTNLN